MRFLVDAQLPARLVGALEAAGHFSVHASQLPDGNRSTDRKITEKADADGRVVITKGSDFRDSHLLTGHPTKQLVVATGNITNKRLLEVFGHALDAVVAALQEDDFAELRANELVVHKRRSATDPS